jgi:hypothetical protein
LRGFAGKGSLYPQFTDEPTLLPSTSPDLRRRACEGRVSKVVLRYGEIDETLPRQLDKLKRIDLAQNPLLSTNRRSNEAVRN